MADTYVAPSKRFSRAADKPAPDYFAPPKPLSIADQNAIDLGASQPTGNQISYAQPKYADRRPGSVAPPDGTAAIAKLVGDGLQVSQSPVTTDTFANIASVGVNALSGAATGALTGASIGAMGGPIGAAGGAAIGGGVALITSGLNAWLGNRQARAERDRVNALNADARRIRAEQEAYDRKWQQENRSISLEQAGYERRKYQEQVNREQFEKTGERLKSILASSDSAKKSWAQYGFQ